VELYASDDLEGLAAVIACVALRDEVRGKVLREDEKELVDAPDCSRR